MSLPTDAWTIEASGQRWLQSFHPPEASAPKGKPHGSAGICITATRKLILITQDGMSWDFPAGRPEPGEDWEATLRREMREEACAVVTSAQLLGYCRGECIAGHEVGLVLVRAVWLAQVRLLEWKPEFEIVERLLVSPPEAIECIGGPYRQLWDRAFAAAKLT